MLGVTLTKSRMESTPDCSPAVIMELVHAIDKTEMLYNAAQLRVFDVIERHGAPMSARDIVRDMLLPTTSVRMLDSLLRVCACFRLLAKSKSDDNQDLYVNTEVVSLHLTSDSQISLLTLVDAARHQYDIAEFIKQGKTDLSRDWFFDIKKNDSAFTETPHRFKRFYLKQDGYAKTSIPLLSVFDLAMYKTVVDLGGGLGTLCRAYKRIYTKAEVTCVDMPRVVDMAKEMEEKQSKPEMIKYRATDMFGDDPLPVADLYILGHLLHMLDDNKINIILTRVHQSLNKDGAVLILEKILNPDCDGPELCLMYDVRMSCMSSQGMERTLDDYKYILRQNGFDQDSVRIYINTEYSCYDAMLFQKA